MADTTSQKVKRVTKKSKAPVVSSETSQSPEVVDNNTKTTTESVPASTGAPTKEKEIRLTEIPVVDEITALNLMVSF